MIDGTGHELMPFDVDEKQERPPAKRRDDGRRAPQIGQQSRSGGRFRRFCLLVAATIFFVLGALGAVLPFLPATPFLLLTSYFLVKSSPRLNAALLRSRFFGPILVDWQVHRGVRRDVKVKAVTAVVLTVSVSLYLTEATLGPALGITALALIGIAVVLRLPEAR